ncbi:MAG: DUF748 domain-containing protein [Desulfobulbaceae bacterium]|jgi:hypothetical protein|nr:DUF748 domain-containing protein [Desulfobulbaceae bacterium]
MAIDRFGEIPITAGPEEPEEGGEEKEAGRETGERKSPDRPVRRPQPDRANGEDDAAPRHPSRYGRKKTQRQPVRLRPLRWLLVPLIGVLLYGVGGYFLVPALIKGPMAGMLAERLERPVAVKRIVFAPFTLDLYLEEVTIGVPRGSTGRSGNFLSCEAVRCRLGLERIFRGKLLCDRIALEGLDLQVRRDAAGFTDLNDVLNIFAPQVNRESGSVWPAWLEAGELDVRGGTIVFQDDLINRQYLVEQLELYLPPGGGKSGGSDRLPKISALVNGSPVRAEAVRTANGEGKPEISLSLRSSEVELGSYLDYVSVPGQAGDFRLSGGQADVELKIVFPREREGGERFVVGGRASVSGLQFVDREDRPVFGAPRADCTFAFIPSTGRFLVHDVGFSKPLLVFHDEAKEPGDHQIGGVFGIIDAFLLSPDRFLVTQLHAADGTIQLPPTSSAGPVTTLSKVEFTLQAAPEAAKGREGNGPARFSFRAVAGQEGSGTKLSAEGEIFPGGAGKGRFSADRFDFQRHGDLLPAAGLRLDRGIGGISFAFDVMAGGGAGAEEPGTSLQLREGRLDVAQFSLSAGTKTIASGERLRCENFQIDKAARRFGCGTLELVNSEIFSLPALSPDSDSRAGDNRESHLTVDNLRISGSRLRAPLLAPLCGAENDLAVDNFNLQADHLMDGGSGNNIAASAAIGSRGEVQVAGQYSPAGRTGSLEINLRHIDFRLFDPCLSAVVVPPVKQGTLHIQGNVAMPAGEFSGQVWMNDLEAGEQGGPRVQWQLATSDRVVLRTSPRHLDLGEIMVRKPAVAAGLSEGEDVLARFFHPGKLSFAGVAVDKVSIEDGRFTPPWPVLLPGYQPELTGINGDIASLGEKVMPFSFRGRMNGSGAFTIDGETEAEKVRSYSLEATDVRLTPFEDFFRQELGLAVNEAGAAWTQTLSRSGEGSEIAATVRISGATPERESPMLQALALFIDDRLQLTMALRENPPAAGEGTFLFHQLRNRLRHQAVRAAIAPLLVVREHLPALELPDHVAFGPGSALPDEPEVLAGYGELLARRPFLRLRLQPVVSDELDADALQAVLQQEEDLRREEENRKRALERVRLEEREIERLAAIREGKATVETEEIDPAELARDLDPLPFVRVEVSEEALRELERKRALAVRDYLVDTLSIPADRIAVAEPGGQGPPRVQLVLEPLITPATTGTVHDDS